MSAVNMKMSYMLWGSEIADPTNGTTKKAADMLIDKPERALSQGLVKTILINNFIRY